MLRLDIDPALTGRGGASPAPAPAPAPRPHWGPMTEAVATSSSNSASDTLPETE